ncbi:MAG: hypothetical protein GEV07_22815 [Streptosporangiales bacterium]|nr:hypothetical protein [Streptosporangiales bacterium]
MHTPADSDGRVGLLADPDLAPAEAGRYLASALPERLAAAFGDMQQPDVTVAYERLPAGTDSQATMLDHAASRRRQWGADVVACITDLPLVDGGRPVAADIDADRGVALISLPAIGGVRLRLLFGMVRANRPWRLATGLSSALIAAFAISAFFLINSSERMLATSLSPLRLAVLTAVSAVSTTPRPSPP